MFSFHCHCSIRKSQYFTFLYLNSIKQTIKAANETKHFPNYNLLKIFLSFNLVFDFLPFVQLLRVPSNFIIWFRSLFCMNVTLYQILPYIFASPSMDSINFFLCMVLDFVFRPRPSSWVELSWFWPISLRFIDTQDKQYYACKIYWMWNQQTDKNEQVTNSQQMQHKKIAKIKRDKKQITRFVWSMRQNDFLVIDIEK